MQAMPSRRVPAPRPGLQSTPQRFSAGPGSRCGCFACLTTFAAEDLISGYASSLPEPRLIHPQQSGIFSPRLQNRASGLVPCYSHP
ncbi:hypothetical protein C3387_21235 [Leclercia sp. LSNIH6]|nr:hypothetical protein C3370_19320 [Leclercia sp. LSNIH7]POU73451.1 hypothetical protein C3387_21235 [Leclercia sp. LSNIH6]POW49255.1 hypothetical protein C3406_20940 [Leclercia sp. LSNIH8]